MAFNNDTSALDQRLAPGAEQARQDVMVDVTVAMTMIGGICAFTLLSILETYTVCSDVCRTLAIYSRIHRSESANRRLDNDLSCG